MTKTISLLCFLTLTTFYCNAQITWEKLFVQSNTDVFRSVQEVPAGGYIAAGYTSHWSSNDSDAFVVRLNIYGDTIWTRTFNGGRKDIFYKVINTTDGGFVLCGYQTLGNALSDAYYMKLDANGNMLWQFTYGGAGTERAQEIIQTSDGGYAMCGYTNSGTGAQQYQSFLVKIDANGGQTWSMKYGGNGYDDANSIKEILPAGGFVLAGQTTSSGAGGGDIWLLRVNATGGQIWSKTIGSSANENAEYLQLTNGGFIIAGSSDSTGADDGFLVKTDTGGVMQWSRRFGGDSPDDFHRVENTSDGGYIITGTTQSNVDVISNMWLYKTDASGDSTWAYVYGGANHDHAYSGVQTSDGGYILCGYTASFGFHYEDALIIKVDGNGQIFNHLFFSTVTALVTPVNGTCGSANSTVTITVRNFGDTALSTFPDTVIITGALNQTLGQIFIGNISPLNSANHTFTATINTSAGGVFNFHCFTSTNNDVYPAMNWLDSTITLNAQPQPPTVLDDTSCGPGSVTLTAISADNIDWYNSSTGGILLQAGGSTYTTTVSNTTTFYAQASNACGTSSRTAVTAYVFSPATPPNVFPADRCGPGDVPLLASAGSPISWWDSATGGILLQGDTNTYIANVTVTTTFYVEAGTGGACPSVRVGVTATVNPLPDAGFTANAPAVCLGDAFQFTNSTTGATSYAWDFGDASGTSVQTDPSYTYTNTGNYTVQLVAVSALNCYDTATLGISVNTAPVVSFTAAPTSGCLPFTANFINSTTNATDYVWNFGDGGTSTDASPVYIYTSEGTYTVTLLATVGSCADSDSVVGMITTHTPPVIDLGPDISTNSVTYMLDAGAGFAGYQWNNGASTQTIVADTNGIYCVVVTDNNTCSDSDCVSVILDAAGIENTVNENYFMIFPDPAHADFTVMFPNTASHQLRIYDPLGRVIYTGETTSVSIDIDAGNWQRGIYDVEILSGDKPLRRRLILY